MKKLFYLFSFLLVLSLSSCLDTVTEVTIAPDRSGTMVTTVELGQAITMLKAFSPDAAKQNGMNMDTTINLASLPDSVFDKMSNEEKELFKTGKLELKMNMDDNEGMMRTSYSFKNISDVNKITSMSGKTMAQLSQAMGKPQSKNDDEENPLGEVTNCFNFDYSNNKITCTLDNEKYDELMKNEKFQQLKDMGTMLGEEAGMTITYKYNLPSEVKEYSGNNISVSDDKKTVIIKCSLEELFESPTNYEFSFEY